MGKEKKESWMETLIELLNEYEKSTSKVMYIWKNEWTLHYYDNYKDENIYDNVRLLIISKEYWFIKRLVENDKIDTSKAKDKNLNGYEIELRIRTVKELVADSEEKTVLYLNLLMLLTISDTPIDDLLLYLK